MHEQKIRRNLRVLVAEDDAPVRNSFRDFLGLLGHEVHTAANGEEALETFRRQSRQLDLVITDIYMPKVDGLQLIRAIRANHEQIPIVAVTGFTSDTCLDSLYALDIPVFFKPLDFYRFETFLQTIG